MSEQLNQCPKCKSINYSVVKVHNPDTTDMNSKATLKCYKCKHEWEDLIASKYHQEQTERGFRI